MGCEILVLNILLTFSTKKRWFIVVESTEILWIVAKLAVHIICKGIFLTCIHLFCCCTSQFFSLSSVASRKTIYWFLLIKLSKKMGWFLQVWIFFLWILLFLKVWIVKKVFYFLSSIFSFTILKSYKFFWILLRFTILITANLERTKSILFFIELIFSFLLILSLLNFLTRRNLFLSLGSFRNLFYFLCIRIFLSWSFCRSFHCKSWLFFFSWLISCFLTNTSNSKRSKLFMKFMLIMMTVTVILWFFFNDPIIRLTWTRIVHILCTNSRNWQSLGGCYFLLFFCLLLYDFLLFWNFFLLNLFRFLWNHWCLLLLVIYYPVEALNLLITQLQVFSFKLVKLWNILI